MLFRNQDRRAAMQQAAQMHRDNLRKNLERRLEAARSRGDEALVRQLEAEANYLQ